MGKFKEIDSEGLDIGWQPNETQLTEMQLQSAQGFVNEIKKKLEYYIDRHKYYNERVTLENLEGLLEAAKDAERTLE